MTNRINLLEELDKLTQVKSPDRENNRAVLQELAKRIAVILKIERLSFWLFNPMKTEIVSAGEYDSRTKDFAHGNSLKASDFPSYFKAIQMNRIILVEEMLTNPITSELNETYSIPLKICSLMDIPLRLNGELIGVMCFEETVEKRIFTVEEQTFAMACASVLVSNLEAHFRRVVQKKYEHALKEKETLIKEINHRVKNNFSVMMSLLRIARDKYDHKIVDAFIDEHEKQVLAMVSVHDTLMHSDNPTKIDLTTYLKGLISQLRQSNNVVRTKIEIELENTGNIISSKLATSLGLIISEIMTNSVKHALSNGKASKFVVKLQKLNDRSVLTIGDDGPGFKFNESKVDNSLGLHLIEELSEDFDVTFPHEGSSYYVVKF